MGANKCSKKLLLGSPLVLIQTALFTYMSIFGIKAIFQVFDMPFIQWSYSVYLLWTLLLCLVSLMRTFMTEPGKVTPALVDKLKNQLLLPKQLKKLEKIPGDINKRQYLLKCMNQAIAKHIARRPNSTINQFANCIQMDMELLELHPTTHFEAQRDTESGRSVVMNLPEVCKFTYCEACEQIMPPRTEHCDACNQCTLRVDHHCVWMGNACIGLLNHKFFILYLFYIISFCSQVAGPFFVLIFVGASEETKDLDMLKMLAYFPNEFISFVVATALMFGMTFMLVYQIVILLMNKTTFEVSLDARRNPFRHRGVTRNIKMVFGDRPCLWFSPFNDPFPDMKLVAFTPNEQQMINYGIPVKDRNSGRHGLDYIQCIIPTIRSV